MGLNEATLHHQGKWWPVDSRGHVLCRAETFLGPEVRIGKRLRGYLGSFDPRLELVEESGLVFIDLETTGLCGGTGIMAFLVGMVQLAPKPATSGRWELLQFFLASPSAEPVLLQALGPVLGGASGLVTFNGKRFDWPLLESRFILNRMSPPLEDPPHVDLLYPARRLWGKCLGSVALRNLEHCLMHFRREFDIPSELVPSYYQMFLASRRFDLMVPVIKHNLWDLKSMVALAARICAAFEADSAELNEAELLGLAGACARAGMEAEERLFLRSLAERGVAQLGPYVKLAKHLEHREKDYSGAAAVVEKALRLFPGNADLEKRLNRLRCKLARSSVEGSQVMDEGRRS
ncbi:MAG: ribonuclease H-like domain-containing protein [Bacillota bacterium]